jgi:hypothetical protein
MLVQCMNLKKMERYLRVNLFRPGPCLVKKEFTGPRSHKGGEICSKTCKYTAWTKCRDISIKTAVRILTTRLEKLHCGSFN